jgi:uncharacterized membrane protein
MTMKRYLIAAVTIIGLIVAFGIYKVEKIPKKNNQSFAIGAADPTVTPYAELSKARVDTVSDSSEYSDSHFSQITATLEVTFLNGSEKGKQVEVDYDDQLVDAKLQEVHKGDIIVVGTIAGSDQQPMSYVLVDRYRLPYLAYLAGAFLILAVAFGRWRGLTAVIGLSVSIGILIIFIAPNILAGKDPTLVTLVGVGAIALVSMFLAHGFTQRTMIAVLSTILTLGLAEGIAHYAVIATKLIGNGTQEAFYIQQGLMGSVNLRGLLLGGILIGTLGILNDITTAQAAAIEELHDTNNALTFRQLFKKGDSVGREHIASLINTLVLTYVGASLPLFLLVLLTTGNHQLWAILNSESLAEEIVRTLIGSMALIIAVPITTAFAAYYFVYNKPANKKVSKPSVALDNYWEDVKEKIKSKNRE